MTHPVVGEVEHRQVSDVDMTDAAPHLERVHSYADEVTGELPPSSLFLIARIPDPGSAGTVTTTVGVGRIGERSERLDRGSLVPEPAGNQSAPRCGGYRRGEIIAGQT